MNLLTLVGCQTRPERPTGDPGTFVNPFTTTSLHHVDIEINPKGILFNAKAFVRATVWFWEKETRGQHQIDGKTLDEVLTKLKAFLEAVQ